MAGLIRVWPGRKRRVAPTAEVRAYADWLWVLPVLAAVTGANAAITALMLRGNGLEASWAPVVAAATVVAIVISWILLHVGFAEIYEVLDMRRGRREIGFVGSSAPSPLDYLYFAFTIGVSFATSDATTNSVRVRRAVLIHSIISFFYNTLVIGVIAVVFQVLQTIVTR